MWRMRRRQRRLGQLTAHGQRLADAFWPGPLTLVLASGSRVARSPIWPRPGSTRSPCAFRRTRSRRRCCGGRRAGRRAERQPLGACQPDHGGARGGRPRRPRCHDPRRRADAGRPGIDGGRCRPAMCPSCCGSAACRARPSPRVLGRPIEVATGDADKPASPGMLARHYAPATRCASTRATCATARRCWRSARACRDMPGRMINLSASGDLAEAAANLFAALRTLDAAGATAIAVMPIPEQGLGEAINDRLRRAANPAMTSHAKPTRLTPELLDRLRAIVGPSHALTDPDQQLPYLRELRDMYEGRASVVLRPGSTEEVSKILALAHEHGIPVVPQAGNTGLVGGQIPMHGEIAALGRPAEARARRRRGGLHHDGGGRPDAGRGAGRRRRRPTGCFPLSLPSEGSCQHRRQPRHQRRRRRRAGLRQHAPAGARPRGGAGRRAHLERPQGAQEGQHRLRPAATCSSARKARSASSRPPC